MAKFYQAPLMDANKMTNEELVEKFQDDVQNCWYSSNFAKIPRTELLSRLAELDLLREELKRCKEALELR